MIKQRSWGDCGVVALLNALQDNGVTFYNGPGGYESMVSNLNGRDYGITIQEVSSVILELGLVPVHIPLDGFAKESGIANAKASTIDPKDGLFKNWSKAIYQVKTKSGLLHFVYFDGYRIWDGSQNSPVYPKFSDYESVIDAVFILPGTPYSVLSIQMKSQSFIPIIWRDTRNGSKMKNLLSRARRYLGKSQSMKLHEK